MQQIVPVALITGILLACQGCGKEESIDPTPDAGPETSVSLDDGASPDTAWPPDAAKPTIVPTTWISIKPGSFVMGSPTDEACRDPDETAHTVTITRAFALAQTEVTQKQFRSLMGYDPSYRQGCGDDCPVEWVSWHEAAAYCSALSKAKGLPTCYSCAGTAAKATCQPTTQAITSCKGYRLPTEAEWEYAARAGTSTALHAGAITSCMALDSTANTIAWYKSNSGGGTHPVKQKAANSWQLHDMSGNVYEWTNDWYQADPGAAAVTDPVGPAVGAEKTFRGGAWFFNAEHSRSANRERFAPAKRFTFVGFRCARST